MVVVPDVKPGEPNMLPEMERHKKYTQIATCSGPLTIKITNKTEVGVVPPVQKRQTVTNIDHGSPNL
jgi:hypothetical protein